MLQRLGSCFLSCVFSLAAQAAEPARNLPNVRAITTFVHLDRSNFAPQFAEAHSVLDDVQKSFAERGYAVQTQRLVTQPLGELVAGLSDDDAAALLKKLDALAGEQNLALNVGPAMMRDGDDPRAMHLLATVLPGLKHTNASAIVAADDGIH
jgi:hypothetical protein